MSSENKAKEEAGKIDDGGSAFPHARVYGIRDDEGRGNLVGIDTETITGMSLRDYFAAKMAPTMYEVVRADMLPIIKAAVGLVKSPEEMQELLESEEMKELDRGCQSRTAELAYAIADAMLSARKSGVSQ